MQTDFITHLAGVKPVLKIEDATSHMRAGMGWPINSSPPGQNGRHFADDIFGCIFLNEKFYILMLFVISLKFVPEGPIDNILALI